MRKYRLRSRSTIWVSNPLASRPATKLKFHAIEQCAHLFISCFSDKNNVIDKNEMLKVLEALYDLTGISEDDRKGEKAPKNKVDTIMKKLDKNRDSVIQFDEFLDGCLQDEFVRKILIDPMFNC